jgi:hypothetical protein
MRPFEDVHGPQVYEEVNGCLDDDQAVADALEAIRKDPAEFSFYKLLAFLFYQLIN